MNQSILYPINKQFLRIARFSIFFLLLSFTVNHHLNAQVVSQTIIIGGGDLGARELGASVALEGKTLLVGAPGYRGTNWDVPGSGAAHIYEFVDNEWIGKPLLYPGEESAHQNFGQTLALNGNWAIIGAPGDFNDFPKGGKVYFFYNNGLNWSETQIFVPPSQDTLTFAESVDIEGEWAVVGVPRDTGTVYIFRNEGSSWSFYSRLSPRDTIIAQTHFGQDVAISGQRIIVGTNGHGAYIFHFNGMTWEEEKRIIVSADSSYSISGKTVAINNNTAIVYADADDFANFDYFEYNGADWIKTGQMVGSTSSGNAIALGDNIAAVGDPQQYNNAYPMSGIVNAYLKKDGNWSEPLPIDAGNNIQSYAWFGHSVAVGDNGNAVIVGGMPYSWDGIGAVIITELSSGPNEAGATNGDFDDRIKISWDKETDTPVSGFNIYRDGEMIGTTTAGAVAFSDYEVTPGKLHQYEIAGMTDWGSSFTRATALGWQPANGKLKGKVNTPYGSAVDSVEIGIEATDIELNSCLKFNGTVDDYVIMDNYDRFPTDDITVSLWIKTTDEAGSYFFSYASTSEIIDYLDNDNSFLIGQPGDLRIWIDTGILMEDTGPTGVSVNDGNWHHLAVTWQSTDGELNIIKDGVVVFTGQMQAGNSIPASGIIVLGQDQDLPIGGGFQPSQSFSGLLDEIRIWDMVRRPEEIREEMYQQLRGDEFNLISYWSFDDLPDRTPAGITGDYAVESGRHGEIFGAIYADETSPAQNNMMTDDRGNYSIENIYYGESALFDVIPSKGGHAFDPERRSILMSIDSPVHKSIDFVDTTIITIGGKIQFAGTNCNVAGVDIIVDDESSGKNSNSAGEFTLLFDRPGIYNIKLHFADTTSAHGFLPAEMNLNVEENFFGLAFSDTTRHWLRGKFGAACDNHIGSAEIIISSINNNNNVFKDTIYTDENGHYDALLPAQPYKVDILDITLSDMSLVKDFVLQYFGPDTVDLTWMDQEHDFTYRNPPVIRIDGWPDFGSGNYNVPILEQGDYYDLIISVLDVWGEDSCLVNQGSITITDVISGRDDEPLTAELVNGKIIYRCVPDEPLILSGGDHPFQKMIQVVAEVGEETVDHIQWAVITGSNPRTQTFTATTPEIPFLILRDPPGDQSYSYLSQDQNVSWTMVQSFQIGNKFSVWYDIRLGAITGTSVGTMFFSTEFEFGGYAILAGEIGFGTEQAVQQGTFNSFTFSQEFSTSDDDAVVGEEGDVYLGASYVNLFALTDVLDYDWNAQDVVLDTLLAWEPESVESFFSYTESHISNVLLPQLKTLRQVESSGANRMSLITKYDNSISVWESILLKNDTLKNEAVYNDNFAYNNISFSAGAPYSASFTDESSKSYSFDYTIFLDTETAIGAGAVLFGVPAEGGIKISSSIAYQRVDETNTTQTVTTGFTLNDDDPGDFFSVNVKSDPAYGTPVFELFGGTSSNPWEKGTQPRDGVNIALNTFVKNNVPPDEPAPFILYLGNTSESGEEREYYLSVVQASNLDGAIIRVGGVVIEDHLSYMIPAGEQLNATLTVERGPVAYDYENLKIKFYAPGDEDVIYDIATFSVHFISPCSDINLLYPENNWVVNASANDTLQIVINNYNLDNQYLEKIKFQYRRVGDGWTTAYTFDKDDINNEYLMEYWQIDELADGPYELRAVSDCGTQGLKYSSIASGIIDRNALTVFGAPEPADGVLNLGENISISFSGEVDPAYLTEQNVLLYTLDDSTVIDATISQFENKIIITPSVSLDLFEDKILVATASGIRDLNGNILRIPVSWSFRVNRSPIYWTISNILYTVYQGKPDSFTRTLKNIGGESEAFTITSYPTWLTPAITNGSIPPDGEQDITFTVNTQMNVGSYSDTVAVTISSGEEKLIVDLNVLHEPPAWSVVAANYAYSMNMTAVVTFDDEPSKDIFDIISVYGNGEIRGVANVQYLPSIDRYLTFITIYSNHVSGEKLTFRMWDASAGKEYAYLNTDFIFTINSSMGTVNDPIVLKSDASVQAFELNQGWTWFSLNVSAENMSLEDVLADLTPTNGDLIKGQDKFSIYYEGYGWLGPLKKFETGKSYQIYLQNGGMINYTGSPVDIYQASIEIKKGWNWIGHLNQNIMGVNETFAMLNPEAGDRIKSQTEFANYMAATQTWEGNLKNLVPGEGYMLKLSHDAIFQYPLAGKSESIVPVKPIMKMTSISYPAKPEWSVDINAYEYNMSTIIVCSFDNMEMRDSTIIVAAFSDYVCRGVTQLKHIPELEQYVGFLPVYSNKPGDETIYFKLYEPGTGKTRDVTETVLFISNAVIGDLDSPLAIEAQGIGDELIPNRFYLEQNYPNPFNPETTIEYGIPVDSDVKIILFNVLGQKVATLVDEKQLAHRYKFTFDAKKYQLASGVYFYQIRANQYTQVRKLLYMK